MKQDDFFNIAKNQFSNALPFVLYRKPNSSTVKGFFQENDNMYNSKELTESGFIFSPFNSEDDDVLIPLNQSNVLEINYSENLLTKFKLKNNETSVSIEDEKHHMALVSKAIQSIKNNNFKKVVISRKQTLNLKESNAVILFQRLLNNYKSVFVYCWYHPKVGLWLGATPETLLNVVGNRFTTMSLAGTQPLVKKPTWQVKETEEQELVTHFIKNNLEFKVNTLSIGKTETIQAGNLLHLRTKISGLLNSNLKTVITALHPTPAVCGLPKKETKQFILKNENYNREFYTGFLGELNLKEEKNRNTNRRNVENSAYSSIKNVSNLYVNLRCMQLTDTTASLYVGGGITKDSIPKNEYQETVNKTETMRKVLF